MGWWLSPRAMDNPATRVVMEYSSKIILEALRTQVTYTDRFQFPSSPKLCWWYWIITKMTTTTTRRYQYWLPSLMDGKTNTCLFIQQTAIRANSEKTSEWSRLQVKWIILRNVAYIIEAAWFFVTDQKLANGICSDKFVGKRLSFHDSVVRGAQGGETAKRWWPLSHRQGAT